MSMQMDAYLIKEQIGTLSVRVGALGDGYWGGGGSRAPKPKNRGLTSITFFLAPPGRSGKLIAFTTTPTPLHLELKRLLALIQ